MDDIPVDPRVLLAAKKLRRRLRLSPEEVFERALRCFLAAHGITVAPPSDAQPAKEKRANQ